jgi:pumilio homology domain family member 6
VQQVVSIWEDLRPRDATTELKQKLAADILAAGKGNLKELAVKSKSSRVIQAVLKHGTEQQRKQIWEECKAHMIEMSMSVHGNHVVRKFISIASKDQLAGATAAA